MPRRVFAAEIVPIPSIGELENHPVSMVVKYMKVGICVKGHSRLSTDDCIQVRS